MKNLVTINRHWEEKFRYPYNKKRDVFRTPVKKIYTKQIIEVTGLRRTGKTTLLMQIINKLLDDGIMPYQIWYFTFDKKQSDIEELLNEFRKLTKINYKSEKLFIFLDEIQKLNEFQSQLKVFYDFYPNLKFFISGSTSLFIKKKTQESLAGRLSSVFVYPLSFKEFLYFKNREEILLNPLVFYKEIEIEYEDYWDNQFIETIEMKNKADRNEYLLGIIKKIIFEDVPKIFSVENPEILYQIVKILSHYPGMIINYENLSNDLNLSNKTLSKYFMILEESFIISRLFNYSKNLLTSEKKNKRVYLSSASFVRVFNESVEKGRLVENVFLSTNPSSFFWRDAYKHEVDFISTTDEQIMPIEIKYKEKLTKSDLQNLYLFSKKFLPDKILVLMKRADTEKVNYKGMEINLSSIFLF